MPEMGEVGLEIPLESGRPVPNWRACPELSGRMVGDRRMTDAGERARQVIATPDSFLAASGAREIAWPKPAGAPVALTPIRVFFGNGANGLEVALAESTMPRPGHAPKMDDVRRLWNMRWGKRPAPVLLVAAYPGEDGQWHATVCGTNDDPAAVPGLTLDGVERICTAALREPTPVAAKRTLLRLLARQKDQLIPGLVNQGLFASHELRHGVPARTDWGSARDAGEKLLGKTGSELIEAMGYVSTAHGSAAHILSTTGTRHAVAVLLDEDEVFDRPSARFGAVSPVTLGLALAQEQNLPWLLVTRSCQIRLYPAKPDVGVGRKGQAETYVELDLPLLDADGAAYLPMLFSPDALTDEGSVAEILAASVDHASSLGKRLRERVYVDVVPRLAVAIAGQMKNALGRDLDDEDLHEAYHRTLIILFRLLFVAYAEDRGLLPYQRNPRYTKKALKTLARDFASDPDHGFDEHATDLWGDLQAVWKAVDDGNKDWDVPAYNGGLFAADADNPSGNAITAMTLTNADIGPALKSLIIDVSDDGSRGPVDFRSLSVREFGTIYEGLLESSLSIAPNDLAVAAKTGAYVPAQANGTVDVQQGQVYFHNASGARKSSGSYFTKAFAVEHLLDTALEPALANHIAKIKALVASGDDAGAADAFFDFRIADLAMGSGHFLVAAIDRIESRFAALLAENPIPKVTDELNQLAAAARDALGDNADDVEVETSMLLRRQIARRCIYGLDLNLMAVELSRLGIWIHTFVPGLPMSALDHGLRVGSSLTGVGTVDEVLEVLEPDRDPGQESLLGEPLKEALEAAKDRLVRAARTAEATKAEVRNASREHAKAMADAANAKTMFDLAVGLRTGIVQRLPLDTDQALRDGSLPDVQAMSAELGCAHMPYLFPEVFLRKNPGFDVLLGNPPWEKIRHEPHQFWVIRDPGLRSLKGQKRDARIAWLRANRPHEAAEEKDEASAREKLKSYLSRAYKWQKSQHYDFAKVFAERNLTLARQGGAVGIVLPQASLMLGGWAPIRERMMRDHHLLAFPLRNTGEWLFEDVEGRMTISLVSMTPGAGVTVHAAADSLTRFLSEQQAEGLALDLPELEALSDELNVPWFEHAQDPDIFTAMAKRPHLGAGAGWIKATADSTRWDFSGSGKHKAYGSEGVRPGAWRVTMTRHVDAYRMTDDPEGKRIPDPRSLIRLNVGVEVGTGGSPILGEDHPPLVFRFPSRNDDSRTLIATALPESGWLYSKGYAHGVKILSPDAATDDILALLGHLNSVPADWWARRFVDRHLGKRIIDGLPLPDWSPSTRAVVASLVAELLRRNGYTRLAGGRALPEPPSEEHSDEQLRARIDALALQGLCISSAQATVMFEDFEDSKDGLPHTQRIRIVALMNGEEAP